MPTIFCRPLYCEAIGLEGDYTSIDPNPNSFKTIRLDQYLSKTSKKRFLGTPCLPPRANCFINDVCQHRYRLPLFVRPSQPGHGDQPQSSGAAKTRTRGGQGPDTEPGHGAQPQSSGARPRQGQEEDKARTQSRATEPSHRVQGRGQDKDKRRTRPGHRAGPRSPATEFRGAAKTRTRGGQGPDTEPGHRALPQSSGARPQDRTPTVNCNKKKSPEESACFGTPTGVKEMKKEPTVIRNLGETLAPMARK